MILKNKDIITRMNILNEYGSKRLPQRISYAITRNVMLLSAIAESYNKELKKIIDSYKEYYEKDEKGNTKIDSVSGLPVIMSEHSNEFISEVMELLDIEVEVNPHFIDESLFDYDGEKYDVLSAVDIINLQKVLCKNDTGSKEE